MRPINEAQYGAAAMQYLQNYAKVSNAAEMPYYMPGHPMEIAGRIEQKNQDTIFKHQKYPLIALKLDTLEPYESGGFYEYDLNLAIIAYTEKNWNYEQRLQNVFKPILQPLYERFIKELRN